MKNQNQTDEGIFIPTRIWLSLFDMMYNFPFLISFSRLREQLFQSYFGGKLYFGITLHFSSNILSAGKAPASDVILG